MKQISYDNKQDQILSYFIVGYFFFQALNLLVKLVIGNFVLWSIISKGSLALLLLLALKPMLQRNLKAFFISESIFFILFSYTLFFRFAEYNDIKPLIMNVLTVFTPLGIATASIKNVKFLLKCLYIVSFPIQAIMYLVISTRTSFDYSMVSGYILLFQAMVLFDRFFLKFKWYDLLLCLVILAETFIYCSRGPLLCFGVMAALSILTRTTIRRSKKIVAILATGALLLATYFFYNEMINCLIKLCSFLGYSSRNLYLLTHERIAYDSGRFEIVSYYLDKIRSGSIVGHGLAGGWIDADTYPHNIIIELMLSFGSVLGVLSFGVIIFLVYHAISTFNEDKRRVVIILSALSTQLFVSGSFLTTPAFFMLISLGVQSMSRRMR